MARGCVVGLSSFLAALLVTVSIQPQQPAQPTAVSVLRAARSAPLDAGQRADVLRIGSLLGVPQQDCDSAQKHNRRLSSTTPPPPTPPPLPQLDGKRLHTRRRRSCSAAESRTQLQRLNRRNGEWWSHSGCPQQAWTGPLVDIFRKRMGRGKKRIVAFDIGCNKGYTSAALLARFDPKYGVTPKLLHKSIQRYARSHKFELDRDCGVCGDCNERPEKESAEAEATPVSVHCFEPSPATFEMLMKVRHDIVRRAGRDGTRWHIHKAGLHSRAGTMWWDKSCATDPGTELCTIKAEGDAGAIAVDVTTVDTAMRKRVRSSDQLMLLKIDAEGYDAEVLRGALSTLTAHRASVVTWEYNPHLGGKTPRGPWAHGENATAVVEWLDAMGYDCYLESNQAKADTADTPSLYRLNAGCLRLPPHELGPPHRGWANVVCASRKDSEVAAMLLSHATLLK
eukprot:TRINITY_DN19278_c0_g1_i1.p1 TRINITY_DN19278_c0_g1~~TRINITY_DN19278_c0_g1_i1.p1  ORF type:complete len:469 (+),score=144.79 TRINITY_DN19278_c0_g1_i1:53-1408(+)